MFTKFVALICFMLCAFATPVLAATADTTPPVTRCITAKTTGMYTSASARLEKEVAGYAATVSMQDAITRYRQEIATAWEALHQPYCGFGSYGTASAIKSFAKSITRAQTAFATASKTNGAKSMPVAVAQKVMATTPAVVPAVTPPSASTMVIPKGLLQGMRSATISELQRRLAVHFSLPADADHVTGYFGPLTRGLVLKFQLEQKIVASDEDVGAGQVGPRTAAALNGL